MSGHNKWSKIKRQKGAADAKRSQIFSKISRAITYAAKQGGGDPDANPSLRLAIDQAKQANMPKDNVQRAIDKGTGKGTETSNYEEVTYEGFGPEGVAIMIKTLTDNKNRTVAEVKNILNRHNGSMGVSGCTSYIFGITPEQPSFEVELEEQKHDKLEKLVEELDENDDVQKVYSNFKLKA
jgi:YebC/PmpR family DNA-binding regulatory protein